MTVFEIGPGRQWTFGEAFSRAAPGDTLFFAEGEHEIGAVRTRGLKLVGANREKTVVRGRILANALTVTLESLTLVGDIRTENQGTTLKLTNVRVHGGPETDTGGRTLTLESDGGFVEIVNSSFVVSGVNTTMELHDGAAMTANGSILGHLMMSSATATLHGSAVSGTNLNDGAKVFAKDALHAWTGFNDYLVRGNSVLSADTMRSTAGVVNLSVEGSTVAVDRVDLHGGISLTRDEHSKISLQRYEPKKNEMIKWWDPEKPRDIEVLNGWSLPGTLFLEPGEYFMPENRILTPSFDIVGMSGPSDTTLHTTVKLEGEKSPTFSNFTLSSAEESAPVIYVGDPSARATLINMVVKAGPRSNTLNVVGGRVDMIDCATEGDDAVIAGPYAVEGGVINAIRCRFIAPTARGGEITLTDCSAAYVGAEEDGAVRLSRRYTAVPGVPGKVRVFASGSGSTLTAEELTASNTALEVKALATNISIGSIALSAGVQPILNTGGGGTITVENGNWEVKSLDAAPEPATVNPPEAPETPAPVAKDPLPDVADPLEEIRNLVGLDAVKSEIEKFVARTQFNRRRVEAGMEATATTMHSIFLGNPGTGKTTVARLLGKALHQMGAVKSDVFIEVGRADLVAQHIGATALKTQKVLEQATGGVLFIDEAYSLSKEGNDFGGEAIETILTFMENHRSDTVIIFAGYNDRMRDFLEMNPGLESRIPNRFHFEDYSPLVIAEIGLSGLRKQHFQVNEDVYTRSVMEEYKRSGDNSNARWIRNFNDSLVNHFAVRASADPNADLTRIEDSDIFAMTGESPDDHAESLEELQAELNSLVGLDSVKIFVNSLVQQAGVDKRLFDAGLASTRPTYHMVFSGNPGTGKTTVARLVAKFFYLLGILRTPTVTAVDRSDLVGSYVGHTEKNTTRVVDQAMGGVLFVDEAYQLYQGGGNDFGRMAIETMITRLEDDRDKFIGIFAGYTEDMEQFLGANPGLRSRIPITLEFPDYTPAEVAEIVIRTVGKSWEFDAVRLRQVVEERYAAEAPANRSNGRWARNFAEQVINKHKMYLATHPEINGVHMKVIPEEVIAGMAG